MTNTSTPIAERETLPPLQHPGGLHGGYRLFNVHDVTWELGCTLSPRNADGRGTVVIDGWGVSYSTGSWERRPGDGDGAVRLNAYKYHGPEEGFENHELYGTTYDTQVEASRAAFEAGLLAFMVYEDERIGKPCYHPLSCTACDRRGDACGTHTTHSPGHDRCSGRRP